jgi:membrane fusion protein (multidrug efflux system)
MFARPRPVRGQDAAIVIPEEAIVPQGGRQFVIKWNQRRCLPGRTPLPPMPVVSMRQEVKRRAAAQVEVLEGPGEGEPWLPAAALQRDGTALRMSS